MSEYGWDQYFVLKEKDEEYEPGPEQIAEYAEFIGLRLPEDENLLFLAIEGIKARLPENWEACESPSGDLVYRNKVTREFQEEHPCDQIYRGKVVNERNRLFQEQNDYFDVQFDLEHNQDPTDNHSLDLNALPAIEEENYEMSDSGKSSEMGKDTKKFTSSQMVNYHNFLTNSKSNTVSRKLSNKSSNWQNSALDKNIDSSVFFHDNQSGLQLGSSLKHGARDPINEYEFVLPHSLLKEKTSKQNFDFANSQSSEAKHQFSGKLSVHNCTLEQSSLENTSSQQKWKAKELQLQLEALNKQISLKTDLLAQLKNSNTLKTELIKMKVKQSSFSRIRPQRKKKQTTQNPPGSMRINKLKQTQKALEKIEGKVSQLKPAEQFTEIPSERKRRSRKVTQKKSTEQDSQISSKYYQMIKRQYENQEEFDF